MSEPAASDPRRVTGKCSECGKPLYNTARKTCGRNHRQARYRRLQRAQRDKNAKTSATMSKHTPLRDEKEVAEIVREVYKDELGPVVREALTEDVLRAAQRLVGLTPAMVDAIEEDLNSSDKELRQRAYVLLARYTLGNQSIMPKDEQTAPSLQVSFNLPRPGEAPTPAEVTESIELRQCMECQADKPVSEFEGPSERCTVCHDAKRAEVMAEFG